MRGSNLAGTISGKLKMVYDVLTLNQQMRVTYVLTLFGNLCIDPFHLVNVGALPDRGGLH